MTARRIWILSSRCMVLSTVLVDSHAAAKSASSSGSLASSFSPSLRTIFSHGGGFRFQEHRHFMYEVRHLPSLSDSKVAFDGLHHF